MLALSASLFNTAAKDCWTDKGVNTVAQQHTVITCSAGKATRSKEPWIMAVLSTRTVLLPVLLYNNLVDITAAKLANRHLNK